MSKSDLDSLFMYIREFESEDYDNQRADGEDTSNHVAVVAMRAEAYVRELERKANELYDALNWAVLHINHRNEIKFRMDIFSKDERDYLLKTLHASHAALGKDA